MGMMERVPPVGLIDPRHTARWLVLPLGWHDGNGRAHRDVRVRELTGADEEALFDQGQGSGAQKVSAFLARVIERIDGVDVPIDSGLTASLSLGDRDYLLLRLRQFELGDAVHQLARCPACAGKVDVDLLISELPLRAAPTAAAQFEVRLPDASLQLRWPNGADQAAIEVLALANPAAANTRLFSRIVLDIDGRGAPSEDAVRAWPLARRQALAAWLEHRLPGPDLYLDLGCPHCLADMSYAFDLHGFFLPSAWPAAPG